MESRLRNWDEWKDGNRSFPDIATWEPNLAVLCLDDVRHVIDEDVASRIREQLQQFVSALAASDIQKFDDVITEVDHVATRLLGESGPWDKFVLEGFWHRRELDMIDQRRLTPDEFLGGYIVDPHRHVLWGVYRGHQLIETFRLDEELILLDVKDDPYNIPAKRKVGVVHPLELPEQSRTEWGTLFADYELQSFAQLQRDIQHRHGPTVHENSVVIEVQPDERAVARWGWRLKDQDYGRTLVRRYKWAGQLEFAEVEIYDGCSTIRFSDLGGGGFKRIQRVHPIVLFEVIRSIQQSVGEL